MITIIQRRKTPSQNITRSYVHRLFLYRLNNRLWYWSLGLGIKRIKKWEWKRMFIFLRYEQKNTQTILMPVGVLLWTKTISFTFWSWPCDVFSVIVCLQAYRQYIQGNICSLLCLSHANKFMREQHKTLPLFSVYIFWYRI